MPDPQQTSSHQSIPSELQHTRRHDALSLKETQVLHPNGEHCALSFQRAIAPVQDDRIVISVHGLASDRKAPFAARVREHSLDRGISSASLGLRGQDPDSAGLLTEYTLSKGIEDLRASITRLQEQGFRNFTVAANSFGGQVALNAASMIPEINRVVLLCAVTDNCAALIQGLQAEPGLVERWREKGVIDFKTAEGKPIQLGYQLLEDAQKLGESIDYSTITADVVAFFGALDPFVPLQPSIAALAPVENLEVFIEKNHGHQLTGSSFQQFLDSI